jgi:hypothetical protein
MVEEPVDLSVHEHIGLDVTASLSVQVRMAFQHLSGAAYFSSRVKALEQEHAGKEVGDFFEEISYNFSACIILATGSIECFLNEVMLDVEMNGTLIDLIQKQGSILERYRLFLSLHKGKKLDQSGTVHKWAKDLCELRSQLYHFKPEWSDEQKKHAQREDRLPKLGRSLFSVRVMRSFRWLVRPIPMQNGP